jgi:hypothetical protein
VIEMARKKCLEGYRYNRKMGICLLKPVKVGDRVRVGSSVMPYHERFIGKTGWVKEIIYPEYLVRLEGSYEDFYTWDVIKTDDQTYDEQRAIAQWK